MALTDYSKLVVSTLEDYINGGVLEDVVFTKTPFLEYAQRNLIEKKPAGEIFRVNIRTGRNNNFQGYGPLQTWTFQPDKGYTRAQYDRKEHVITAVISGQEEEYNTGDLALFDIVKETTDKLTMSLEEDLEKRLIRNHGQTVDQSKEAHGLELLVGDSLSTYTKVGNIDALDAPWWQSIVKRPGYDFPVIDWENIFTAWTWPTDTNTTQNPYDAADVVNWQALTLDMIDQMITYLNLAGEDAKLCLTTPDIKQAMVRLLKANGYQVQRDTSGKMVGATRDNVVYRNIVFVDSIRVKKGDMFFLCDEGIKIRVHPNKWMVTRPWISPYDQDAKYMAVYAWFQMYSVDRRSLGKIEKVAHK